MVARVLAQVQRRSFVTATRWETVLTEAFRHALDDVAPAKVLPAALPAPPHGRTIVVGAGKAAASMAQAVEQVWAGELSGLVVVPYGHVVPCRRVSVVEAAHPVPDALGLAAARGVLDVVSGLGAEDLVIALFSGGGSALLPLPAGEVGMDDKRSLASQLLRAGANIREINCVRKHLSAIKGGHLACACAPARVANLLISDVAGDDPSAIASGPLVPDTSTLAEARYVIERYELEVSEVVRRHLSVEANETPKPGDSCFAGVATTVVASSQSFLESAARFFADRGVHPLILGDSVEGEAKDVALVHAAVARQVVRYGQPAPAPCVIMSGGETTVTVRGGGLGGRNSEFLLALVVALGEDVRYAALACDTDGIDGAPGAAGAVAGSDTLRRASAARLDARRMLDDNDSRPFFAALGDTVVTGPTLNNVNDFRAIVVLP